MKKFLAVFMAMLMVVSISVPSFATELNSSNSSVGASATAEHGVESSYRITIPAYVQATQTEEFPTASDDEEKIAIAESIAEELENDVERIVSTHQITYYSAILLIVAEESDEFVALAKQGDDVLENAVEAAMSSEFGTDADGNSITDINDYFNVSMGITLKEVAMYMEYGALSVPKQFEKAVYYDVAAKGVLIDDMKELRVTVSYDNVLSDSRGAELNYNIYNKYTCVNDGDVVLKAASGNPEEVYSTKISAMVEPVRYAGTFTDTVTFNASVDFEGDVYEIGATKPENVLAVFNKDHTKVVIKTNGDDSDGLMRDFTMMDESNPMYKNVETLETAVFETGVKNVGSYAFGHTGYTVSSHITSLTLCDTIESIGEHAFLSADILEVTIPSSVKTIGENAFASSLLKNIVFENGVETIEEGAFYNCWLTNVNIPASVKNIDFPSVFFGSLTMYNKITAINISADNPYFSSVDGVVYNKDMTSLLYYPLYKTGTTFTIPETVVEIGKEAFRNNQYLTTLKIPDTVKILNDKSFYGMKSLTSLQIGCSAEFAPWCFTNCEALKTVVISEGVTSISKAVFQGCNNLVEVTIPNSVTKIDYQAFNNCNKIKNVYGTAGSYAETWATEKGLTFVALN